MAYTIFGRQYAERYDAIVIGGGIGGLFCANFLAKEKMKVLLLERHYVLGGYCSSFRRKGYLFDAATHFYPLLGNPTTLTGKLVAELGLPTEWIKMDPVDQFHLPSLPVFAVPAGFQEYLAKLKEWFPAEAGAIDRYFAELRQAYLHGLLYYFKGVDNDQFHRLERQTVQGKLEEHFRDAALRTILMADCAHWGSLPGRTSYCFDAMLRLSYFLGNYFPRGGSQQFADDLGRALEERGGSILKCAAAEKILVEDGKACGVSISTVSKRATERYEFRAPVVVSNADAVHTYRNLLGEEYCGRKMLDHLTSLKPTYPCYLLHLGLRGMDADKLREAEGYYWSSYEPEDVIRTVFKVFIPTRFDESLAPPGGQILIVQKLTPVRLDEITDWTAHKTLVEEGIMARLRALLPGIDEHIVVKLSATAQTSHKYTNNWQGAMLGWEMSPEQLGSARLPMSTPVENLYLTGHWTQPGGGITPVIISAQKVAQAILQSKEGKAEPLADYNAYQALVSVNREREERGAS